MDATSHLAKALAELSSIVGSEGRIRLLLVAHEDRLAELGAPHHEVIELGGAGTIGHLTARRFGFDNACVVVIGGAPRVPTEALAKD